MIRIHELKHGFGGRTVLNIPRWGVAEGELSLVIGPSGSGKTTLLRLLGGLAQPDAGVITVGDVDITELQVRDLDRLRGATIAMVSEELGCVPTLTVRSNLVLAARLANAPASRADIDTLLQRLEILHCAGLRPASLSHGEAQRAAIARALIARPKLLLADEPTSALDDENAARVVDVLRQHARQRGAAVVIASHDFRVKGAGDRALTLTMGAS